jgi:hypothetical protein
MLVRVDRTGFIDDQAGVIVILLLDLGNELAAPKEGTTVEQGH